MSKIEKALQRARGEKSLVVVQGNQQATDRQTGSQNRDMVAPEHAASDLKLRAKSASAIALMREQNLRDKAELTLRHIINPEMANNSTVQAFRDVRTKVLQKTNGKNCVIMVTSVTGQAGSTFVATNLGMAFAFDAGKTALLVDCNLRNPGFQKLFPDGNPPGLTDYLEKGEMDIAEIIHAVGIERLRVIPAGDKREIPSEYFTSSRMRQLLDTIRQRYVERFIILDAPSTSETADTRILAELCDFIILVVPYGGVTSGQIEDCVKSLDSKKLLGIVFNNEPHVPDLDWKELWKATFTLTLNRLQLLARKIQDVVRKK